MEKSLFNIKLLKTQVYEIIKEGIRQQRIKPGSTINLQQNSKELGISRTPLRDALLQLEMEGFVTISPRRGVYVNRLTPQNIKDFYQIIGALEKQSIISCKDSLTDQHIERMEMLTREMWDMIEKNDVEKITEKNDLFHSVYLSLPHNAEMYKIVENLKKRLCDFCYQDVWPYEWTRSSLKEHETIINLLKNKQFIEAGTYLQQTHWSYDTQEPFIRLLYYK